MIEIIYTKDGSHTLRNAELNETYHSIHGAVQESRHVFIKNALDYMIELGASELAILEVGFGTGLNTWLTAKRLVEGSCKVSYTTLESMPLDESIWLKLNYAHTAEDIELFKRIHHAVWNQHASIARDFSLTKLNTTIQQASLPASSFDVVYFDAFAPEKQPEMWDIEVLKKVFFSMKQGGVFVTYCAKGQVKRDLKNLGMVVETLPGPPGKREMIRAKRS